MQTVKLSSSKFFFVFELNKCVILSNGTSSQIDYCHFEKLTTNVQSTYKEICKRFTVKRLLREPIKCAKSKLCTEFLLLSYLSLSLLTPDEMCLLNDFKTYCAPQWFTSKTKTQFAFQTLSNKWWSHVEELHAETNERIGRRNTKSGSKHLNLCTYLFSQKSLNQSQIWWNGFQSKKIYHFQCAFRKRCSFLLYRPLSRLCTNLPLNQNSVEYSFIFCSFNHEFNNYTKPFKGLRWRWRWKCYKYLQIFSIIILNSTFAIYFHFVNSKAFILFFSFSFYIMDLGVWCINSIFECVTNIKRIKEITTIIKFMLTCFDGLHNNWCEWRDNGPIKCMIQHTTISHSESFESVKNPYFEFQNLVNGHKSVFIFHVQSNWIYALKILQNTNFSVKKKFTANFIGNILFKHCQY